MESKYILVLAVILGCALQASAAPKAKEPVVNVPEPKIRAARQALDQASQRLQENLIKSLANIANNSANAGTNVSRAANTLLRGIVTNTFSLGGVVGYLPRLTLLDGPTQFLETLRLARVNQARVPTDVNSAIDTLITFADQSRQSGIGENFSPVITFFPNLFTGVGDFLTTFIDSLFSVVAE